MPSLWLYNVQNSQLQRGDSTGPLSAQGGLRGSGGGESEAQTGFSFCFCLYLLWWLTLDVSQINLPKVYFYCLFLAGFGFSLRAHINKKPTVSSVLKKEKKHNVLQKSMNFRVANLHQILPRPPIICVTLSSFRKLFKPQLRPRLKGWDTFCKVVMRF